MSEEPPPPLIAWVDIPVKNLDRAIQFYRRILNRQLEKDCHEDFVFAMIKNENFNCACLVPQAELISRDNSGILIYFNVENRIEDAIEKTNSNGGEILEDIHDIGPHGFRAIIADSEGNRIALHSNHRSP
jgi:uncharacterized protein